MARSLLTADSTDLIAAFGAPQWGIWKDGSPVLVADSVARVQYARDYQIPNYPQEKGAFESYNKVQIPYDARVGFYISTSRREFLNSVEAAVQSRDLVTFVMPEKFYESANLTHYSFSREVRAGVTLILVEVWCKEVRIIAGIGISDPQSTNAVKSTQSGQVQPIPSSGTFADSANIDPEPNLSAGRRIPLDPPT